MSILFKTPQDERANKKLREEFTSKLRERLKEVRKEKKMTQQELAEKAGLHLTYVGHLELGKYHPTVFVMWKIAKALGVSVNELTNL
ncbi:MAG: helix-turn-helix protein [Candidatus Woesebacteria bacterium GW2011_GWB1_39_10b]|uniref:Helix-turn-helix protein n=2 Tax=Candidatus Woeseibacteriota TaxID=1752722 RepID=A0A0G0NEJ2_9BACT|nr:MAG: helix-turn-helix protein [Microgenomates group bacterium GW2011_GWC1_38_12]KKQ94521.1 MAG: helix-turn-helix protein [Candidatus Woesebacteria bacterium GW2011_GWB1_39_10b]KKR13918.1 MAG: helix-turn-helix protein [Candidatus Woesebacteria bacterium GW2011_GWA1_39_21b]